jgi:hypothetical protein
MEKIMNENKSSTFTILFSEALLIAILTAGAYLVAFSYEAGYLSKFSVPLYLIKINIEILLFLLGNFIAMLFPEHPALQEKVIRILILLIFPISNLINYGLRKEDIKLYLITFCIIILLEILWPFIIFRKEKSIKNRFIADEIAESKVKARGILGRLHLSIGPLFSNLIYIIILGAILANSAGKAKAITQKEYYLLGDNSNIVIIRIYSDMLIGISVDSKTKLIGEKIIIQKIGENHKIELFSSKIGPLNFK